MTFFPCWCDDGDDGDDDDGNSFTLVGRGKRDMGIRRSGLSDPY